MSSPTCSRAAARPTPVSGAGDVIVEVDRKPVSSPDALRTALEDRLRPALLLVQRGPATLFLTLERQ